jgi:hypothetical protein
MLYPFNMCLTNFYFICLCLLSYFGHRCELNSIQVLIKISQSVQRQLALSIDMNLFVLVVVYLADIHSEIPKLTVKIHLIYSNLQFESSFSVIHHRQSKLSHFVFLCVFFLMLVRMIIFRSVYRCCQKIRKHKEKRLDEV